jgi:hypothetical protein
MPSLEKARAAVKREFRTLGNKGIMNKNDPGFFDTWLIVATRFLITSYEAAMGRIHHDRTPAPHCGS